MVHVLKCWNFPVSLCCTQISSSRDSLKMRMKTGDPSLRFLAASSWVIRGVMRWMTSFSLNFPWAYSSLLRVL